MTSDQLRGYADKTGSEGENELEDKVKKRGYLKCDLYSFESDRVQRIAFEKSWGDFWLFTKNHQQKMIKEFEDKFSLVLKEGTEFVCYVVNGVEEWYDNVNYGVEGVSKEWAEKYLRDIEEV